MFEQFFSFQKKISKRDSLTILKSIRALTRLGYSFAEAIKIQNTIEEGANKKIFNHIVLQIDVNNIPIEDVLLKYGVIGNSEYLILQNSKDIKQSLDNIIQIRSISNNFLKTITKLFVFPFVGLIVGLLVVHLLLPVIKKPVDELIQIAKIKHGVEIDSTLGIPKAFFYIQHPEWTYYIFGSIVIIILISIFAFKHYSQNNPSVLYKILPLKAYDDLPYIFILMRSLNKGGLDMYSIATILEKSKLNKGWKKFFKTIRKQVDDNKPLYVVFQKFNFPKQIYVILKTAESSKSFWETFDETIKYTEEMNKIKNEFLLNNFKGISVIVGYSFIIYFLLGVVLLMFSMQNVVTALQ